MTKIERTPRTLRDWEEDLMPQEMEALIVSWQGGIASAYHIKSIISRVYGIEL